MIGRTISDRLVTFTERDPHYSHMLFTCPLCGTYTFLEVNGGQLKECPEDCANHPRNSPYPDYDMRYFGEVEHGPRTASQLSGQPEPSGPDDDGFFRRNRWNPGTTEQKREIFIPGTGWVAA